MRRPLTSESALMVYLGQVIFFSLEVYLYLTFWLSKALVFLASLWIWLEWCVCPTKWASDTVCGALINLFKEPSWCWGRLIGLHIKAASLGGSHSWSSLQSHFSFPHLVPPPLPCNHSPCSSLSSLISFILRSWLCLQPAVSCELVTCTNSDPAFVPNQSSSQIDRWGTLP